LPHTLAPRLRSAGFEEVRMQAHAFTTCELDPEAYGAAMLPFIATFVVGREEISDAEGQAWLSEQQQLGARGEFYFAVTQLCFTATKPAG
jgi:hypothetical protein